MNFLAIETSCDETAAAVFTDELAVRSSVVASQTDLHARFGGVVPEIAAHQGISFGQLVRWMVEDASCDR